MLNIINHQGNANQNHNELSPHTCQNVYSQKDKKQQVVARMWRKGNAHALLVGCKLVQTLWKRVWRFLKKLKIELPYHPAIPLLGIFLKKMETLIQKDTCVPIFTAALFTIAKIWKQPKCP